MFRSASTNVDFPMWYRKYNERSEEEEDQEFPELVQRISPGETTAEEYVTLTKRFSSCEPPVNTTFPNWRQ